MSNGNEANGKTKLSLSKAGKEARQVRQYLQLRQRTVLRYLLVYFLASVAWIIVTDWLLFFFFDSVSMYQISLYKGWLFVLTSSLIFYFLLRRRHIVLEQAIDRLEDIEARFSREINIDQVSGLPNRRVLEQEFYRRLARDVPHLRHLGLILFDIDDLGLVNDAGGYAAGNQILRYVGQLLQQLTGAEDLAVHLGGDEFAVLLDPAENTDAIIRFAGQVRQKLRRDWQVEDLKYYLGLSIGGALYPAHGTRFGELLQAAETAMRVSKRQGKDSVSLYEEQELLNNNISQLTGQISDLRQAIAAENIVLHYQPEYSLKDGHLRGLEALCRLRGRDGSLIAPSEFIPLAEKTGLIVPLTGLVCEMVRRQVQAWQQDGIVPGVISINLSGQLLGPNGLAEELEPLLAQLQAAGSRLELEITESSLMENPETAVRQLRQLRRSGISIALDDFGSGYSSLTYLRSLPVDLLKIDRHFISTMLATQRDSLIVSSIIDLAHNLDLEVTAEGIETAEQKQHLARMGCDLGQGYLLCRPLPPEELAAKLLMTQNTS